MIEHWKEFTAIVGGLVVVWRFLSMNRRFVTKEDLEKKCNERLTLVRAEMRAAVLEAMNQWLRENGHKLR